MMMKYLRQLLQITIVYFVVLTIFIIGLMIVPRFPDRKQNKIITIVEVTPTIKIQNQRNLSNYELHTTKEDCWIRINDNIYDLTRYFDHHPGGNDMLEKYCGKDASQAFVTKDGMGNDHSQTAYTLLQKYRISNL